MYFFFSSANYINKIRLNIIGECAVSAIMSLPKRRRLTSSELLIIGDSDDSNSSLEYCTQFDGKQDKLVVQPGDGPCSSVEADQNEKRKRPIKAPTPNSSTESDDDDLPTGIPPYMSTEKYDESMKDTKEKRLIWNRLRHGKY